MHIKKAVFPVAGLGSRFLPATKANPKEMLPVVDKPLIQYAVEEAMRAGITHMIFITSSSKRAIEDHFDNNFELEMRLKEQGKNKALEVLQNISSENIDFTYVRQKQPLGLGDAVLCSESVVGKEPFAVLLADDLIDDLLHPCLTSMVDTFHESEQSIIAVQAVPWNHVQQYGIVEINNTNKKFAQISSIVEKPIPSLAPSNFAAVGRYIFTPEIFDCLKQTKKGLSNEIQLTDAIENLLKLQNVEAYKFNGKRYDCGSKLGYLQATMELAMRHPEVGIEFKKNLLAFKEKAEADL